MKSKYLLIAVLLFASCKTKHKLVNKNQESSIEQSRVLEQSGSLLTENSLIKTSIDEVFKNATVEVFEYDTNKAGQTVLKRYTKAVQSQGNKTTHQAKQSVLMAKDSLIKDSTGQSVSHKKSTSVKVDKKTNGRGIAVILFLSILAYALFRIWGIRR